MAKILFRYFSKDFFSPYYFPPLANSDVTNPSGTASISYGDDDAFAAVLAALKGTGEFAEVFFGVGPDPAIPADSTPLALVSPEEWSEEDDVDPNVLVRRVSYVLTIRVRDDDPSTRFRLIERLSALSQDAMNGSNLGGGCLAALTTLRRGRFTSDSQPPEQSVSLLGEFSYLIPSVNGHLSVD